MTQLGNTFRRSTGPLYSQKELAKAEKFLAAAGLTHREDNADLGMRIYSAGDGKEGQAVIYLDELHCHPNLSGTMIIAKPGAEAEATTVWDYVRKEDIAATTNPFLRFIKHCLP